MQANLQTGAALIAALAVAALSETSALAQNDARLATERCRTLPTEGERFDCMERLVLDLSSAAAVSEPEPTAVDPESEPIAVETPVSGGAPERAESGSEGRRLFRLPFSGEGREEPVRTSAAVVDPETYGTERLQARDAARDRPEPLLARVVSFEEVVYQRLRVELDNGQVWEQRESVPPWREEQYGAPDEVEIFPSRFGGYRMRLVGANLTLGVERVR